MPLLSSPKYLARLSGQSFSSLTCSKSQWRASTFSLRLSLCSCERHFQPGNQICESYRRLNDSHTSTTAECTAHFVYRLWEEFEWVKGVCISAVHPLWSFQESSLCNRGKVWQSFIILVWSLLCSNTPGECWPDAEALCTQALCRQPFASVPKCSLLPVFHSAALPAVQSAPSANVNAKKMQMLKG